MDLKADGISPRKRKEKLQREYGGRKATAVSAQQSVQKTANISKYVFRTPNPLYFALPIVLISMLYGLLVDYIESGTVGMTSIYYGLALFLMPAATSLFAATLLDRILGGRLYLRRSAFLCFVSLCAMGPLLLVYLFFGRGLDVDLYITMVFVYAFVIWPRHLFIIATSNSKHLRALFPTITQPVLGFISVHFIFPPDHANMDWALAALFSLIFLCTIVWFLETVKSPMLSDFSADLWENVGHALAHMTERGRKGVAGLERFFQSFSEPLDVYLGVVGFRTIGDEAKKGEGKNGTDKKPLKALMIIPSIHPGPFGIIGGSDLTRKVGERLAGVTENLLMFHGPATHDINIASTSETGKVASTVRNLVRRLEFSERTGRFVRDRGRFHVCTQFFGDNALSVYTSAPEPSDDIDYSTGYMSVLESRLAGASEAVLVDAHNCLEPGAGGVYFGTRRSFEILRKLRGNVARARNSGTEGTRIGVAQDKDFSVDDGLAGAGIQAMVVEAGEQRTAYILYDGNNMVPGLREAVIEAVADLVDEAEVFTSDNHRVNVNFGGYNPVGLLTTTEVIVERSRKTVLAALGDLESVEAGMKCGTVKDLRVFGVENTARLTSIINSSTSVLVKSALATIAVAVLGCTLVMTFIP